MCVRANVGEPVHGVQWTATTAGGCPNDRTSHERNPKFTITVSAPMLSVQFAYTGSKVLTVSDTALSTLFLSAANHRCRAMMKVASAETVPVPLRVRLFAPRAYSVGMTLRDGAREAGQTGAYRSGFAVLETTIAAGVAYTLVPSTFLKDQVSPRSFVL